MNGNRSGLTSKGFGALLALIFAGSLAACGGAADAASSAPGISPVITIDCAAFEAQPTVAQDVRVGVGQQIVIKVCSNPSTGFGWQASDVPATIVRLVDQSYLEPGSSAGQPGVVGAAGIEALTFEALAAGAGDVHLAYSQPWTGGTKGAWNLTLHVVVA